MNILNIGISHQIIRQIKQLKKHPQKEFAVVEDLATFQFLKDDLQDLKVFVYCQQLVHSPQALQLKEYFIKHSVEVYEISNKVYEAITEKNNAAGFIAIVEQHYVDLNSINPDDYPFIVVGDGLENPGNLGTLIRTCDATNVDLLITCNEISKLSSPKVLAASRGMVLLKAKASCDYEKVQKFLLDNGYTIYLGEPKLGKDYQKYSYQGKVAIVVGNERFGITPSWYDHKHEKVFVPMSGLMESLNVSVAASILIYEAYMKRK